jgi:hypothetical protein
MLPHIQAHAAESFRTLRFSAGFSDFPVDRNRLHPLPFI